MDTSNTTRRGLLRLATGFLAYGAGAAAVAGGGFAISEAKGATPPTTPSPEFAAVIAASVAAERHTREYHDAVYYPASDRCTAMINAIPHVSFETKAKFDGAPMIYSTADASVVAVCQSIVANPRTRKSDPHAKDARRLVATVKRRERAIARARRESGLEQAYTTATVIEERATEAADAVEYYPVTTLPDLVAKLAYMEDRNSLGDANVGAILAADVRRIAKQEG